MIILRFLMRLYKKCVIDFFFYNKILYYNDNNN